MARIDLHNFFKFFDETNPNHVAGVAKLEIVLGLKLASELEDSAEWIKTYRTSNTPNSNNLDVPFYPQTDNYTMPSRSCNSSSCAMYLEYFKPGTLKGTKGDDEYLRKVLTVGDTTDHEAQTKVLESYGVKSHFSYNLSFADLDRELAAKRPIVIGILHRGTLSNPTGGHMIVIKGKTKDGDYICNDPFGSLNDGYTGPVTNGRNVVYKKSVLEKRWTPDGPKSGWGRIYN